MVLVKSSRTYHREADEYMQILCLTPKGVHAVKMCARLSADALFMGIVYGYSKYMCGFAKKRLAKLLVQNIF